MLFSEFDYSTLILCGEEIVFAIYVSPKSTFQNLRCINYLCYLCLTKIYFLQISIKIQKMQFINVKIPKNTILHSNGEQKKMINFDSPK